MNKEIFDILESVRKEFEKTRIEYTKEKGINFKLSCLYIQKIKLYTSLKEIERLIQLFENEKCNKIEKGVN